METVFKVGMEVYDQVNFPDKKGKVIDIESDVDSEYVIEVQFVDKDNIRSADFYSLSGVKTNSTTSTLSTKPYKVELRGFEQKRVKPTIEEGTNWLLNRRDTKDKVYSVIIDGDVKIYPNKEVYKAFEALRKLIILRDYYNEDWKPNWSSQGAKYFIEFFDYFFTTGESFKHKKVLCFKSSEIRDKFLKEQSHLLEIAKPLL